jgi:hypothetical protein
MKSLNVLNQSDAEPEMMDFLREVKAHPEQRNFVANLFNGSVIPRLTPWQFIQFCMHDLRWPEVRDFIRQEKAKDVQAHGARSSTVWDNILEAFEDNWKWAENYNYFSRK